MKAQNREKRYRKKLDQNMSLDGVEDDQEFLIGDENEQEAHRALSSKGTKGGKSLQQKVLNSP